MGWEPTEVHEYEYHPNGAVHRIVVTREPEWDDEQRAIEFELRDHRRRTCPHGHHSDEGMDPGHVRWVDHATVMCLDCHAIEEKRRQWHKAQGHPDDRPCDCRFEQFHIERREPISEA